MSLLTTKEVPEEADVVMIYNPQSDISSEEADILGEYAKNGGRLLVMAGPVESGELTNLNSILDDYNISVTEGIVIEGDSNYYAFGYPYVLMPEMATATVTESLINENYYAIMPLAQGLEVETTSAGAVTQILTTSYDAFSKVAGYEMDTYEKEDGDIEGPFALAVAVESNEDGRILWFTSSEFISDMYNAYSSGANVDLAMNSLSSLIGEREAIAIRSKSLNYNYLTITDATSSTLKTLMIGVFPLAYLGIGVLIIMRKRGKQNETI